LNFIFVPTHSIRRICCSRGPSIFHPSAATRRRTGLAFDEYVAAEDHQYSIRPPPHGGGLVQHSTNMLQPRTINIPSVRRHTAADWYSIRRICCTRGPSIFHPSAATRRRTGLASVESFCHLLFFLLLMFRLSLHPPPTTLSYSIFMVVDRQAKKQTRRKTFGSVFCGRSTLLCSAGKIAASW